MQYSYLSARFTDILLMMGGIGCFISSAITMLVFFPRSMTMEAGSALPHPNEPRPRPGSGSRSDDTVWDGASRKPARGVSASTSQLDRPAFNAPLFINGTPIYVEEVPQPEAYPLVHPYVSFLFVFSFSFGWLTGVCACRL
jgi:hypothetical protein